MKKQAEMIAGLCLMSSMMYGAPDPSAGASDVISGLVARPNSPSLTSVTHDTMSALENGLSSNNLHTPSTIPNPPSRFAKTVGLTALTGAFVMLAVYVHLY